jgi:trimeric autotransporter adhesin
MRNIATFGSLITKATVGTAFAILLAACGGGGNNNGSQASVRIVHVSPGTESITATFGGATAASQLKYHDATAYQGVNAGSVEFVVKGASSGSTLVDITVTLTAQTHYTFLIYGGGTSVSTASTVDDISTSSANNFNLRFSHGATGIGPLDLYLLPSGVSISDSAPAYTNLSYANVAGFFQFANGDYDIVLAPTGSKEIIYESGKQTLAEKSNVTVLAFSTGSGKLVNVALLLSDNNGTTTFVDNEQSRFKFIDASSTVSPANVLIDGSLAIAGIPYGAESSYSSIAAGGRNVRIEATSNPGTYVYDQSQTLAAGYDVSFVAYSASASSALNLVAFQDNNLPSASGRAKLRVVNASADSTAYDTYVNYTKLLSAVSPATASAYEELDASTYILSFAPAGSNTQTATLTAQMLNASHVYTVYVYGPSNAAAAVLVTDL